LQVVDAAANLTGFFIAVKWGIVAVAISYVIVGCLQVPLWFWTVKRLVAIKVSDYLAALFAPLASVAVMLLIVLALKYSFASLIPPVFQILLGAVVGSAVYVFAIYRISPVAASRMMGVMKVFLPAAKGRNS
jgi:PST family polysaccharide transporter